MHRGYTRIMKKRFGLVLMGVALIGLAPVVRAASSSSILEEVTRTHEVGRHVIKAWWLPTEYWVETARAMGKTSTDIDRARRLFRTYLVLAVLDAGVNDDGTLDAATLSAIGSHLAVRRNGRSVKILHAVNPAVADLAGELSYFLSSSLGALNPALRIFFFSNVDSEGHPVLQGISDGILEVHYTQTGSNESFDFYWHSPLTSLAGTKRCPKGHELLEASWHYCPWHGVPVR